MVKSGAKGWAHVGEGCLSPLSMEPHPPPLWHHQLAWQCRKFFFTVCEIVTLQPPAPPTNVTLNQSASSSASLYLIGSLFCHSGCFVRSVTTRHLHYITHLLCLTIPDWALNDREFLIGQSAPRLANKNRVRECSGRYVSQVFAEMFTSESWMFLKGQRSIRNQFTKKVCSFPGLWTLLFSHRSSKSLEHL